MKYFFFEDKKIRGPYAPKNLLELPAFSEDSLVCPEDRKGTRMEDWQRAGRISEIAECLLNHPPPTAEAVVLVAVSDDLPPSPPPKDPELQNLQRKLAALEASIFQLREETRLKDSKLTTLNEDLLEKNRLAEDLKNKLASIEERVAGVSILREHFDKAGQSLAGLNGEIEKLKSDFEKIEHRQNERASAPAQAPTAPVETSPAANRWLSGKSRKIAVGAAAVVLAFGTIYFSKKKKAPLAVEKQEASQVLPMPQTDEQTQSLMPPSDAQQTLAPPMPPPDGQTTGMLIPPLDSQTQAPSMPPPDAQNQEQASALNLVKAFPSISGSGTIEQELQGPSLEAAGLSPWAAEKSADGSYKVSFYGPPNSSGMPAIYEFEVRLNENTVIPHNEAARHLMGGTKPTPPPSAGAQKKKKSSRAKSKPVSSEISEEGFVDYSRSIPKEENAASKKDLSPALEQEKPSEKSESPSDAKLVEDFTKP